MKFKSLLLCTAVLISVLISVVSAVTPVYCSGNPKCSDINCDFESCSGSGCSGESFKLEGGSWGGNHNIPGTSYYINIVMENDTHFTFTSNAAINAVIVKGGPNANVYLYDLAVFSDAVPLSPPPNKHNCKFYAISHIEFCYEGCNVPVPEFPPFIPGLALIGSIFAGAILIDRKYMN